MAGRYSLTIQVDPTTPGHVAVVVNRPSDQTYAGFGPRDTGPPWFGSRSRGKFDPHTLQPGEAPPKDYSNVLGRNRYATFTIPISDSQAEAALAEIKRIDRSGVKYNAFNLDEVCSTIANQIMQAAGLGKNLYAVPQANFEYLTDIARTLAVDPKAQFTNERRLPIPEALRGLQQDYAYVGGGYDTPSERTGHVPSRRQDSGSQTSEFNTSGPAAIDSVNDRFGNWGSVPTGAQPPASDGPDPSTAALATGALSRQAVSAIPAQVRCRTTRDQPRPMVRRRLRQKERLLRHPRLSRILRAPAACLASSGIARSRPRKQHRL